MSNLGKDSVLAFLLRGAGFALSLATVVASARLLGPDLKGAVNLSSAVAGLAATALGMGLGTSVTVGLREAWADRRASTALVLYSLVAMVLTLAFLLVPAAVKLVGLSRYPSLVLPIAVMVGGLLANEFSAGVLQGLGRVKAGAGARLAVGLGQSGAMLILLFGGVKSPDVYGWSYAVVAWVVALVSLAISRMPFLRLPPLAQVHRLVNVGMRNQLVSVLLLLNYRLDMVILAALSGTADVGIYAIAVGFSEVAWLVVNSISAVLLPHLAAESEDTRLRRVSVASRLSVAATLVTVAAIGAALYLFAIPVFGSRFAAVAPAFLALSVGLVTFVPFRVLAIYCAAVDLPELPAKIAAVGLAVNIVANFVLIPRFASIGAGASSSISYTLVAVLLVLAFSKRTGMGIRELLLMRRDDMAMLISLVRRASASVGRA